MTSNVRLKPFSVTEESDTKRRVNSLDEKLNTAKQAIGKETYMYMYLLRCETHDLDVACCCSSFVVEDDHEHDQSVGIQALHMYRQRISMVTIRPQWKQVSHFVSITSHILDEPQTGSWVKPKILPEKCSKISLTGPPNDLNCLTRKRTRYLQHTLLPLENTSIQFAPE